MKQARERFQQSIEDRRGAEVRRRRPELQQIAQAEVPIKALTHDRNWNYFLSLLQAQVETLDRVLVALQESQIGDSSFEHAALAEHKARMGNVSVQRDTLQRIIELPQQIIEHGEKATLALHDYADD